MSCHSQRRWPRHGCSPPPTGGMFRLAQPSLRPGFVAIASLGAGLKPWSRESTNLRVKLFFEYQESNHNGLNDYTKVIRVSCAFIRDDEGLGSRLFSFGVQKTTAPQHHVKYE